jgi:hypothetical protein
MTFPVSYQTKPIIILGLFWESELEIRGFERVLELIALAVV